MGIFLLMGIWLYIDDRAKKTAKKAERNSKETDPQVNSA
jgi:hypothetical protein